MLEYRKNVDPSRNKYFVACGHDPKSSYLKFKHFVGSNKLFHIRKTRLAFSVVIRFALG